MVIPTVVALSGVIVAGLSAVLTTYFENRDARRNIQRQLDLATKRTEFIEKWISVSRSFGEHAEARTKALAELNEAYDDAQVAIQQSQQRDSSVFRRLGFLLMLQRRESLASYVASGLFLFASVAIWMLWCIPEPGFQFSVAGAVLGAISMTFFLRVLAEVVVRGLEGFSRWRSRRRDARRPVASPSPDSEAPESGGVAVADQLRLLVMIQPRRNMVSYAVSALFVLGVSASALVMFQQAIWAEPLDDVACAARYDGGYYGEVIPDDQGFPPYDYSETESPTGFSFEGDVYLQDDLGVTYVGWESFGYVNEDGSAVPEFFDVYLWDDARLTDRRGNSLDKECKSIQVKLTERRGTPAEGAVPEGRLLYGYFDEYNNYEQVEFYLGGTGSTTLEGYYATDDRFMPVCTDERPSLYTCIDPGDVYYDSGAYRLVSRLVSAGFWIIGIALAARLVAGLLVFGLEQFSIRRARRRPPKAAPQGV